MTSESKFPLHVAIIMDGNGRWAERQGFPRIRGHERGAQTVRLITEACAQKNIRELTLFSFSADNWKRPKVEIDFLMELLRHYLIQEFPSIMKNNIRFRVIGRWRELSTPVQGQIQKTIDASSPNTGMILRLALNYSGKTEILDALRSWSQHHPAPFPPETLTESSLREHFYEPGMSDPDLLIRTADEYRLSDFLLWQISYTELWITPTLWPDFQIQNLEEALGVYARRERHFGGVKPTISYPSPGKPIHS